MPQDLTRNDLPAKKISPALSPELQRLLGSNPGVEDPAAYIGSYLALREEARAALPVLKAAAGQHAGREGIADVIGRRFALYPQPDRSDAEWAAWWADYFETLDGVTWPALEAAMAAWVADPSSEFIPKPGKLLELARTTPNRAVIAYERAAKAVGQAPEPLPRPQPTEAEKAQVRRMLADFTAKVTGKPMAPAAPLPSTAGKPDAGGLTSEMRAAMERREGRVA